MPDSGPRFTFAVTSMGCKANLADSHGLESSLRALGGFPVAEGANADLHLLNTCTVTDNADKEAGQLLRRSRSKLTVATGCFAEVDPERLLASAKGSTSPLKVLRNSAKDELSQLVEEWLGETLDDQKKVWHGDRVEWHSSFLANRDASETNAPSSAQRTRVFLKVQDGCNAFCSYCVIPLARGRSRSLAASEVVREVEAHASAGVKEVALTAIHAADYESEGLEFTGLVERVLAETKIPRLRLTSLDPAEIPDRLLELMRENPRLCPHFHVSIQSANSRVLTAMKRGYQAEQIEDRLSAIQNRLPHAFVGMDLIAGFPGESDEEFEDAFLRLERLPWSRAHVFPFSVRRNTAAARLVESGVAVAHQTISQRAARLRALSDRKLNAALLSRVGTVMEILIEAKDAQLNGRVISTGHSRSYFKVAIPGKHTANELRRVKIVGVLGKDCLKGELV